MRHRHPMLTDDVRVLDLLIAHGADLHCLNEDGESLWMLISRDGYDSSTEANFRRLAKKGVYPNKVDYYRIYHLAKVYPCYQALLTLMQEVMMKNGISFLKKVTKCGDHI